MALQDLTPQLRTRLNRVEWYVGLFLGVTALLMLGAFAYFLKHTADARGWFVTEVPYYTYLGEASGLKAGTPVNMMGFRIGEVTGVEPLPVETRQSWDYYQTNNFNVFVAFKVRAPYPGYINTDSRVRLGGIPLELAGGATLEVTVGTTNGVVTWRKLESGRDAVLSEKFAYAAPSPERTNQHLRYADIAPGAKGYYLQLDQGETLMAQANRILAKLDHLSGTVDAALPDLLDEVQTSLGTVRRALPGITNEVQQLLTSARLALPDLTNNLQLVLGNTRDLTAQLRDAFPMITNSVDQTLGATRQLASNVTAQIPLLSSNLNVTLTNVNVLLTRDTNLTANTSLLLSNVNQVLTRHWLLRSAFKTKPEKKPKR
jgi:hypothetical protein